MNQVSDSVLLVLAITLFPVTTHGEAGTKTSDADIAKLLVGKWVTSGKAGIEEREFTQIYRFNKDETFTLHSQTLTSAFTADVIHCSGTWKVSKGSLEITIAKWQSSNAKMKTPTVPYVRKMPLASIDDEMWKTAAEDAVDKFDDRKEYVFKRQKE
jgi:hypothetical protein